ncbi:TPA: RNA polymerase sigma factor RpoD [Candidatus Gastranaerophilales bacterium HUM_20]|jgi:RNA polymerase sigma factor, sigma-70 family|nr:rNA polymerase sigma factor [Clostridium sp. CAG:729]DAB19699.1 MAG TPA: RNA polymerase sigma factor RpoD [Candidatus Gastranaerophilales bacterium HUM_20]
MKKNSPIKMKTTKQFSNPAKNEVLDGSDDSVLSNYIREISDYRSLTPAEEKETAKKAKEGDEEAKNKLIKANLKLVITIAKKAIHMSNLPMIDLIQEGNLGLMVAAEKFNYKLGYKFATYASWWIKQSMFKAISEQSHCMKIPVYIQETLSKFSKIKREMERENNSQVNAHDVAKKMNIAPDKIDTFLNAYSKTISIESGLENSDGKEINVADIIEDEKASATNEVEFENLRNDILNVISTLKEREQEVVKLRYGLENDVKLTLEEIGNIYGVTKECIRQTELRALKKMRFSTIGQEVLTSYVD